MRTKKVAECHPELPHRAKGMCASCYKKYITSLPHNKQKKKERDQAYRRSPRYKQIPSYFKRLEYKRRIRKEGKAIGETRYRNLPSTKERVKAHAQKPESKLSKKKYRDANKERYNEWNRNYSKTERGRAVCRSRLARRRARQANALPKWANLKLINEIYRNCPEGHEVDHIIPLVGVCKISGEEVVCGLHHERNLQYLTVSQNRSKSNKVDLTSKEYHE